MSRRVPWRACEPSGSSHIVCRGTGEKARSAARSDSRGHVEVESANVADEVGVELLSLRVSSRSSNRAPRRVDMRYSSLSLKSVQLNLPLKSGESTCTPRA